MGLLSLDARFDPYRWVASTLATLFRYDLDPSRRLIAPEPEDAHTTEVLTCTSSNGCVPALLFRPKVATGAAVVFGHGIGVEKLIPYFKLINSLLKRGITVASFELDGHGQNLSALTYPECLSCAPSVLRTLRGTNGIDPERIGYLGMSLGSVLGIRAAMTAPWLRAMVLIATPLRVQVSEWTRLREAIGTVHPINAGTLVDASMEHVMSCFFNHVRFGPELAYTLLDPPFYDHAATIITGLDPLGHAPHLPSIPTRLIQGDWDTIVPPESAYELLEALPGPAELHTFSRKNHFTILFHQPAADAAAEWFEQHL